MPRACHALHSRAEAPTVRAVLAPPAEDATGSHYKRLEGNLDAAKTQQEPDAEQQAPPGQFISDEHEADCSRFLEEVKEFVRRRHEAGLGRER